MTDTRIMRCGHCLKQGDFELRGEGTLHGARLDDNYHDGQDITTWRILECIHCKKPTLEEVKRSYTFVHDDVFGWQEPYSSEIKILYPTTHLALESLPSLIEKRYKEAIKVYDYSPASFVVMAGRTLEAVCKHEKATGKTLQNKIESLDNSGHLPKKLAEMAHQIRQIRNWGAHDTDEEEDVTEEDTPILLDFVEAILEYLYVAPAKIEKVRRRLGKKE